MDEIMKVFRYVLAVLAGYVLGSAVNMALIMISGSVIPPPDGADLTTTEGLKAAMHLFGPQHFIFPFLAHALGTFAGAWIAAMIAPSKKMVFAFVIAGLFLIGGVASVIMLPSPMWFIVVDLVGAYIPMGYLAWVLLGKSK